MARNKFYYYVLVMTGEGPVFVTGIDIRTNMAYWDKMKEPYCFGTTANARDEAQRLVAGLNWNGNPSYVIQKVTEQTYQPFMYENGHFKFMTFDQLRMFDRMTKES